MDADPPFGTDTLSYRLKQLDTDGTTHLSEVLTVARSTVQEVQLHGSFPNPARVQATIHHALPRTTEIRLEVYAVLGRRAMTLANGRQDAGRKQIQPDDPTVPIDDHLHWLLAVGVLWGVWRLWGG